MEKGPLFIQNSLSRKKEKFKPLDPPYVGLYVCGPTVYSDVHLGNVRTFLTFDILFRYLKELGYQVRYVRNITDVGHLLEDRDEGEDKIGKRARLEGLEPMEIVHKYTVGFHDVMKLFNIQSPSIEPIASGHIIEQIEMIQKIIDNGWAYEVNGSVYFDVLKYSGSHDYGKLSGRKIEDLLSNTRELEGQKDKKNSLDFAIWKNADPEHLMHWPSPWGEGFPGWHLECSVMSTKYLGETFDIHGGGMDLKFPHHECEIAQSVGADGIEPVRYWMHGNMLTVNGSKMSKSEGNGFTPEELLSGDHKLLEKGYGAMPVRFFMLQGHYAGTLDFSNTALQAAEKGYARLMTACRTLGQLNASSTTSGIDLSDFEQRCYKAMNDDLNTPVLISVLFDGVKSINLVNDGTATISSGDLEMLKRVFNTMILDVLGFRVEEESNDEIGEELMELILELRAKAKANKDYSTADLIRDELAQIGISVKDTKDGASWGFDV